jgi:N-carbamoyl-L-amino-acid hydrolase
MAALLPELADRIPGLRATCGCFTLLPGMINVIAREASFTVDLRHANLQRLDEAEKTFTADIQEIARLQAVSVDIVTLGHVDPQTCDLQVVRLLEESCRTLEYPYQRMVSGAGHDAQAMAYICPAAMIFVPSRDGISHSPAEYSSPDDLERGVNVLLQATLRLAKGKE